MIEWFDPDYISDRIAILRTRKNISARDMSFSLGQSQSYINNIENKKALPSMQMFLEICRFLEITPRDFFDDSISDPWALYVAEDILSSRSPKQLRLISDLMKEMK
ncbi:MAG: helix-turn-helix transcriptional regulator [Oscillospiraceae bacterium]|nr:helix-turn-helix transcriptional regulator [Oscillospiraceae bacterium]